jgi:DNA end-binding protein Ku
LVQGLDADFNPKEYRDEFQERLNALIEAKLKGRSIAVAPEAPRAPVIDIMQASKKSRAATRKKEEARPEVSRPAPAAVARRRRKAG